MNDRWLLFARLYRLKLFLTAMFLVVLGLLASTLADWMRGTSAPSLLLAVIDGLADVLLVTGAIGIAVDFFTGRDKETADTERLRKVLREAAPDIRNAIINGFAETPDKMLGVATPETLDRLAANALALRLGDAQFASEVYTDLRDQAIRAAERWVEVNVSVRLSTAGEWSSAGVPLFDVLVEWEYTTIPSHAVRRFACVSDRDDYDDLTSDSPSTSTWFMTKRPELDARDRTAYELLYFAVDGEQRPIRRQQRKAGQTYSASIGDDVVRDERAVRIKHLYRVRIRQDAQYLFIDLPQPTKNLSLKFDYTDTPIERLTVIDLVTSAKRPDIMQMPEQVDAREVSVDLPGWLLPRAGFTFVWNLSDAASVDAPTAPVARSGRSGQRRTA